MKSLDDLVSSMQPQPVMPPETMGYDYVEDDEVTYDEQAEAPDFQENIAESIDEADLEEIASDILEKIEQFKQEMEPFLDTIGKVREQMGMTEYGEWEEPFPGATSVVYPMIVEAQIQFYARALPEIYPSDPVNSVVIGPSMPIREEQAKRVRDVMNYQITFEDTGNKKDFRRMLWWLPLTGSTFRRVFHDPLTNKNIVRMVRVEDMIVPYATNSLLEAPIFAHRIYEAPNDIKKLKRIGYYRDIELHDPLAEDMDMVDDTAQDLRNDVDGKIRIGSSTTSGQHEIYDVYVDYDIPGYEDVDEDGEETGIALPYIITIHNDSKKILAIRRNWKQDDELKLKRVYFAQYKYLEGPGFYGCGLPHVIGSLQEAATGALRAFSDSLAFALLPGGWKSEDAKFSGSEVFGPGLFQDVSANVDDINKSIKIATFPAPPQTALSYIEMLAGKAQTIVSTQNVITGDQNPVNAPVGTTLALIEQAQKVITAQHQGLHESFSEELQILFDLNYDFLPESEIFYAPGVQGEIRRQDFDDKIMVVPTADPAVASFQQRLATDQAAMQMAQQFPTMFRDGLYPLVRRVMTNLKTPSLDEIMLTKEEFMQQQQAQQGQPSPDQMKYELEQMKLQIQQQKNDSESQIKDLQAKLAEKKMDMEGMLRDKEINARYMAQSALSEQVNLAADAEVLEGVQDDQPQQQPMPVPQMPQEQPQPQPEGQPMPPQEDSRGLLMKLIQKVRGGA